MTLSPVIVRELQGESRNQMTYWLRVMAAAVVIVVFMIIAATESGSMASLGSKLFTRVHTAIYLLIWLCVPAMTADCIAREKREGTLSLLFLTPLTAGGVAIGKSFAQLLRASTLVLATLPVLAVPLLLGGVHWLDLVTAFTLELCALVLSLFAGLFISSKLKNWGHALIFSGLLAGFLAWGVGVILSCSFLLQIPLFSGESFQRMLFEVLAVGPFFLSFGHMSGMDSWSQLVSFARIPSANSAWIYSLATTLGFVALIVGFLLYRTIRNIRAHSKDALPSPRKEKMTRIFATPLFKRLFRKTSNRALDRNPIGWLEIYRTQARVVKWFAALAAVLCVCVGFSANGYDLFGYFIPVFLLAIIFTAAGSFRREKETGAMELILVTCLTEDQIIWGRLSSLLKHFLPTLVILTLPLWFIGSYDFIFRARWWDDVHILFIFCLAIYFSLPLIGLYFSLRVKNFVAAVILTAIFGFLAPFVGFAMSLGYRFQPRELLPALIVQIMITIAAWLMLRYNLKRRNFAIGGGLI